MTSLPVVHPNFECRRAHDGGVGDVHRDDGHAHGVRQVRGEGESVAAHLVATALREDDRRRGRARADGFVDERGRVHPGESRRVPARGARHAHPLQRAQLRVAIILATRADRHQRQEEWRQHSPGQRVFRTLDGVAVGAHQLLPDGESGRAQRAVQVRYQRRDEPGVDAVRRRRDLAAGCGPAVRAPRPAHLALVAPAHMAVDIAELRRWIGESKVVADPDDDLRVHDQARPGRHVPAQRTLPHHGDCVPQSPAGPAVACEDEPLKTERLDMLPQCYRRHPGALVHNARAGTARHPRPADALEVQLQSHALVRIVR
eukprot:gene4871-biopygen8529